MSNSSNTNAPTDSAVTQDEDDGSEMIRATSVEDAIAFLSRSDKSNFYAYVINSLEKIYAYGSGTFYVTPRGNRYALVIDPDAVKRYSYAEIQAIMEHEVLHVVLNHIPRGMRQYALCTDATDKLIYWMASNIAMDAAVNEIVRVNHAKTCAEGTNIAKSWVSAARTKMPPDASYEEYLTRMMLRIKRTVDDPEQIFSLAMKILHTEACAAAEVLGYTAPNVEELMAPAPVAPEDVN
jgi:hypothetical protein